MARRTKFNPVIATADGNTFDYKVVAEGKNTRLIKVEIPEMPWLHCIRIELDSENLSVAVQVIPSSDDDANTNAPELTAYPDGAFRVRS